MDNTNINNNKLYVNNTSSTSVGRDSSVIINEGNNVTAMPSALVKMNKVCGGLIRQFTDLIGIFATRETFDFLAIVTNMMDIVENKVKNLTEEELELAKLVADLDSSISSLKLRASFLKAIDEVKNRAKENIETEVDRVWSEIKDAQVTAYDMENIVVLADCPNGRKIFMSGEELDNYYLSLAAVEAFVEGYVDLKDLVANTRKGSDDVFNLPKKSSFLRQNMKMEDFQKTVFMKLKMSMDQISQKVEK